ncbi:MAG: RagB/SusD family nutrient uptake outer membrane protein, partial [Pedobacter sp.]
ADLNTLMVTRWDKTKVYPKYASTNATQVTDWILKERRKELVNRGLRWGDLKRLNKLGYNITLKRSYNAGQQTLAPNSLRYAMSLPEYVIEVSTMPQNP